MGSLWLESGGSTNGKTGGVVIDFRTLLPENSVWKLGRFLDQVAWSNRNLVQEHKNRMGPQTRCENIDGTRFWVWTLEEFEVAISNKHVATEKRVQFRVPEGSDYGAVSDAMELYREALGVSNSLLTVAERRALTEQGREALKGHELPFPSLSKEDRKAFVFGYCDGQIWTDRDCRGDSVAMVFMPIALGAIGIPEDVDLSTLPPEPGDKPQPPKVPKTPKKPPHPIAPESLDKIEPDPEILKGFELDVRWEDVRAKQKLERYLETIAVQNRELDRQHETALSAWTLECAAIDQEYQKALDEIQAVEDAQGPEREAYTEALRVWKLAKARYDAARTGANRQFLKDFGCFWEFISQAGPRSINGMPIFWSCRLMGKEDMDRCVKAIAIEQKRREAVEI